MVRTKWVEIGLSFGVFAILIWFTEPLTALFGAWVFGRFAFLIVKLLYTARRLGADYLRNWRSILRLTSMQAVAGRRRMFSWVLIAIPGGVGTVILIFRFDLSFLLGVAMIWFLLAADVGHTLLPPAVLLLAKSGDENLKLVQQVKGTAFPMRAVSLLDNRERTISLGGRRKFARANLQTFDNMRIADEGQWRAAVDMIVRFVPIVVIDATETSPALEWEADRMRASDLAHKAWFITREDGESPLLRSVLKDDESVGQIIWKDGERQPWFLVHEGEESPLFESVFRNGERAGPSAWKAGDREHVLFATMNLMELPKGLKSDEEK